MVATSRRPISWPCHDRLSASSNRTRSLLFSHRRPGRDLGITPHRRSHRRPPGRSGRNASESVAGTLARTLLLWVSPDDELFFFYWLAISTDGQGTYFQVNRITFQFSSISLFTFRKFRYFRYFHIFRGDADRNMGAGIHQFTRLTYGSGFCSFSIGIERNTSGMQR